MNLQLNVIINMATNIARQPLLILSAIFWLAKIMHGKICDNN
jgi:hypothetical protein